MFGKIRHIVHPVFRVATQAMNHNYRGMTIAYYAIARIDRMNFYELIF